MAKKFTQDYIISQFKDKHGDKFNYDKFEYLGDGVESIVKCVKHNLEFKIQPQFHKKRDSGGCKECSIEIRREKSNRTPLKSLIKEFNYIHNNFYDYSLVDDSYNNAHDYIHIICPIHGEFSQSIMTHKRSGCSKCGDDSRKSKVSLNLEGFINKSNKIHLGFYDYTQVNYLNNHTKVDILCPSHGLFTQSPHSHLRGSGCPKCKMSHGERYIKSYLDENDITYIPQHKFENCKHKRQLPFDFYLPEQNVCIEFNGEQHYRPVKTWGGEEYFSLIKKRDKIKSDYCLENGIDLIIFHKDNLKNLSKIIK